MAAWGAFFLASFVLAGRSARRGGRDRPWLVVGAAAGLAVALHWLGLA